MPSRQFPFRFAVRAGFTLIELMISVLLMLVLMIGVNYVFSAVGKASSATQTSSRIIRDIQAAQATIRADMAGAVTNEVDLPYFMIKSQPVPHGAFRTALDQKSSPVPANALVDVDGTIYTNTYVNHRSQRIDQLKFFATGAFPRLTGNPGTMVAEMTTGEALISYGHLRLHDGTSGVATGNFKEPAEDDAGANPYNFYSAQWILGRNIVGLVKPDASGKIYDRFGNSQNFHEEFGSSPIKSPLASGSPSSAEGNSVQVQMGRYDLAGTSMGSDGEIAYIKSRIGVPTAGASTNWWSNNPSRTYRFWGNRLFPRNPPPSTAFQTKVSQTSSIFVDGCTQFIVEFAGDYLAQDPQQDGLITGVTGYISNGVFSGGNLTGTTSYQPTTPGAPDGEIDYFVDPLTKQRSIRWYGFPRDVNGNLTISADDGDVVPLRDVIRTFSTAASAVAVPMERRLPTWNANYIGGVPVSSPPANVPEDYLVLWGPGGSYGYVTDGPDADSAPDAIPMPDMPRMIRIIMAIDDPSGNIAEAQLFETVIRFR
jgi:prepilin-type N-terminal cleavage/methylation domain-containing protein